MAITPAMLVRVPSDLIHEKGWFGARNGYPKATNRAHRVGPATTIRVMARERTDERPPVAPDATVTRPSKVALVDDHEVVALALAALIDDHPALEYVGHASSVDALLERWPDADLVVLDLSLRDDALPSANVARIEQAGSRVLVLTSGENPFLIREVSRSGALGIVRKSAPADEILDAVERAAVGEPIVTTEWAAALDGDPELASAPLSPREREVLALYASGLGAKQVARQLHITENTVDDHIRRIRRVYGRLARPAHTKVELYQRSLEDGYLPVPTLPR